MHNADAPTIKFYSLQSGDKPDAHGDTFEVKRVPVVGDSLLIYGEVWTVDEAILCVDDDSFYDAIVYALPSTKSHLFSTVTIKEQIENLKPEQK